MKKAILLMGLLIVLVGCLPVEEPESVINETEEIEEVAGIGDVFQAGSMSFQLTDVTLLQWAPPDYGAYTPYKHYTLYWTLEVVNNGDTIENVSDCGILLFEDGSQYNFDVIEDDVGLDVDITAQCNYYKMVPGAKETIYSTFYFAGSPNAHVSCWWRGSPVVWKDIPGSNITYFSQQNTGLVKFIINKSEVVKDSEPFTPYYFEGDGMDYEKINYIADQLDRFYYYQRVYC